MKVYNFQFIIAATFLVGDRPTLVNVAFTIGSLGQQSMKLCKSFKQFQLGYDHCSTGNKIGYKSCF